MKFIEEGSVTSPKGFQASGIIAGLKRSGLEDMALLFSETPCVAAAAFTQNLFAAAPVNYSRAIMDAKFHHGVLINSGVANACTGEQGEKDAVEMADLIANELSDEDVVYSRENFFICSTGRIGPFLPMNLIASGVKSAVDSMTFDGGIKAAKAIMTTDTVPKYLAVEFEIDGKIVTIGGMTKGAGMINPQMKGKYATMLAYLTTDACVEKDFLQWCLDMTLDVSFNRITVDGDTSTNDSYFAFANGLAENTIIKFEERNSPQAQKFLAAMKLISGELARKMVLDGEGATRFVEIVVKGGASREDAKRCAEAIANSALCKTAWFGGDPNW
ncbi:MAG: bifunctional glutamate N-acetyltransferase/amino-acid acetyltransferase ArgJ, partial [Lentisphaeria bacterium]